MSKQGIRYLHDVNYTTQFPVIINRHASIVACEFFTFVLRHIQQRSNAIIQCIDATIQCIDAIIQ